MGSFHVNTSLCVSGTEESRKKGGGVAQNRALKAYSRPSVYTGAWFQDQIQPEVGWSMHTETVDTEGQLHCYWGSILQAMGHQVFYTRLTKWVVLGYITKGLYKLLNDYLNSQNSLIHESTMWDGIPSAWGFPSPLGQGCVMTYSDLHSSGIIKPSWTPSSIKKKKLYIYIYIIYKDKNIIYENTFFYLKIQFLFSWF